MFKRIGITVLGAVCFCLSASNVFAQEAAPDFYRESGPLPNRQQDSQRLAESVDPFSGLLKLRHVDVFVPGNGGFDLKVQRTYSSAVISQSGLPYPSPFGYGWDIHFGRVSRGGQASDLCYWNTAGSGGMPVFELPDGSTQVLVRDDGVVGNGLISAGRSRAVCNGTEMTVITPDGTRYVMGRTVGGGTQVNRYLATSITDRNGNSMTVSYSNGADGVVVPTGVSTSDGRSVSFSYTGEGQLKRLDHISASGGRTWNYSFETIDTAGFLTRVQPPAGSVWTYAYNADMPGSGHGRYAIRRLTYPTGGTIDYTYGRVTFASGAVPVSNVVVTRKSISPGGNWDYSYAPSNGFGVYDVTTVSAPKGTTIYRHFGYGTVGAGSYWKVGLLAEKVVGTKQTEVYSWTSRTISNQSNMRPGNTLDFDTNYQAPLLASKQITRDGTSFRTDYSQYDTYLNPQKIDEPDRNNRTTYVTYATPSTDKWVLGLATSEAFGSFSITRAFDANGNKTSETRYGVTTSYAYDQSGNVARVTNARAYSTDYSDYYRGVARRESHPVGVTILRSVSDAGFVMSETDGDGDTTGYSYDGIGRLTGISYPSASSNNASISWSGGSTTRTLMRGGLTETTRLDGFGRVSSVSRSAATLTETTTYSYDADGNRTFESYPSSSPCSPQQSSCGITMSYDILGRMTSRADPAGNRSYSHGGLSMTMTNERGSVFTYSYRAYGDPDQRDLMGISAPSGSSITIARNGIGRVTSVSQGGVTRTFGYDTNGNFLTSMTDPEAGTTTFGRDGNGNMTSRTRGGLTTAFGYDGLDRLTSVTHQGGYPRITKTYYGDGNLQRVEASSSASESSIRMMTYDGNKNLITEQISLDGLQYLFRYSYTANDGLETVTFPSGQVIDYDADAFGRPTKALPYVSAVSFHPGGALNSMTYANGVSQTISLNTRRMPEAIQSLRAGTQITKLNYTYDAAGNVSRFDDFVDASNTITSLTYDAIDRLLTASTGAEVRAFTYDDVGNIRSRRVGPTASAPTANYSYDGTSNRLTQITGGARNYSFTYDAMGNVIGNGSTAFGYNNASQMVCARCGAGDQSIFAYDDRDLRYKQVKSGVSTFFVHGSGGQLLLEHAPVSSIGGYEVKEYAYVAGQQVAVRTISGTVDVTINHARASINVGGTNPTGSVTFREAGVDVGVAPVVSGFASIDLNRLSPGRHTIVASYPGSSGSPSWTKTFDIEIVPANDVVASFGSVAGTWRMLDNSLIWTGLHGTSSKFSVVADIDHNGQDDLVVDFGAAYGIWIHMNNTNWVQLHGVTSSRIAVGDFDRNGQDDLVVDFGPQYGIFIYQNNTSWIHIHATSSKLITVADIDRNGQDDIVIDFGSGNPVGAPNGIWIYKNNGTWVQLHSVTSREMVAGDVDKNGHDDLVVDFGPDYGTFIWLNNSTWKHISPLSGRRMVTADVDGNGADDLIMDFGVGYGIFAYMNNTNWVQLYGTPSTGMAVADLDGNGRADVIIDFGSAYGLYAYMNGGPTWRQLHNISSSYLATGEVNGN